MITIKALKPKATISDDPLKEIKRQYKETWVHLQELGIEKGHPMHLNYSFNTQEHLVMHLLKEMPRDIKDAEGLRVFPTPNTQNLWHVEGRKCISGMSCNEFFRVFKGVKQLTRAPICETADYSIYRAGVKVIGSVFVDYS